MTAAPPARDTPRCATCDKIDEGQDEGAELADGRWACSEVCWDVQALREEIDAILTDVLRHEPGAAPRALAFAIQDNLTEILNDYPDIYFGGAGARVEVEPAEEPNTLKCAVYLTQPTKHFDIVAKVST